MCFYFICYCDASLKRLTEDDDPEKPGHKDGKTRQDDQAGSDQPVRQGRAVTGTAGAEESGDHDFYRRGCFKFLVRVSHIFLK